MATAKPKEEKIEEVEVLVAKKSNKILLIIIGILVAMLVGNTAYFFLVYNKKPEDPNAPQEVKKKALKDPLYIPLDPFTVNLSSGGQYLQTTITLQTYNEIDSTIVKKYLPFIRSKILLILSSHTAEDLGTSDGKKKLIEDIQAIFSTPLANGLDPIKTPEVFIISFVIQ